MGALNRKLIRDLWRLRGQVIAIALVIGSGVALLMMALGTLQALGEMSRIYYERYTFAHVFAGVKRAPEQIVRQIALIPGVQTVETRIAKYATLDIDGFEEPATARLISIPETGTPALNRLAIKSGRSIAPGRSDEVVLSQPFADEHGLHPGDSLQVVMNGRKESLTVVGVALSPEFIYAIAPGALMPDDKRFGILWMSRKTLEAAYDLDGAFNDVTLTLIHGTQSESVITALDRLLDRYGGVGAIERADQLSNWFLMNELKQQRTMSTVLPTIFLLVAAFLANMVLARLIATERSEIGLMKAFGYSNWEVAYHYGKMVLAITMLGVLFGWIAGYLLARYNTQLYAEVFHFPFLYFRPGPAIFAAGAMVSIVAVAGGTLYSILKAARLPPAEAMRPPSPPMFKRSIWSNTKFSRWLDESSRIVVRQIGRQPGRTVMSVTGVALSVAVLILALQWLDGIDELAENAFYRAQRQNVTVGLVEARATPVLHEFRRLPGVLSAEAARQVSTDFRVGTRLHRGAIDGIVPGARLQPIWDTESGILPVPPDGLVLSRMLAEKLGVSIGDKVDVSILEGRRPSRSLPVIQIFEKYIGMYAYMNLAALGRLLGERPTAQHINLLVDPNLEDQLFQRLKDMPTISAVTLKSGAIDKFHETVGDTVLTFISFFVVFSCFLAFGVVYNAARIALSERGRELATLRVLGFSRSEITYILLAELGLLVFVGLPLGCLLGWFLFKAVNRAFVTELFRIPDVINPSTIGLAVLITFAASVVSALVVARRLGRLDLMAVLKTRE